MTAPEPADRPDAAEVAAAVPEPGDTGHDTLLLTQPSGDPEGTQPMARPAGSSPAAASPAPPRRAAPDGAADGAPDDDTATVEQPGAGRPPWLVAALAVGALLLVAVVALALATGDDDAPPASDPQLPDGVPTQLEEPLSDLHEAIHGSQQ